MKKNVSIILLIIFNSVFSQNDKIETNVLDSLLIRSINSRLDLALSSGFKYFEPNEYTERIKNRIEIPIFKFPNNKELFNLSTKSRERLFIYRIEPKVISKDTIDINFGTVSYKAKRGLYFYKGIKFKKTLIGVSCGGTHGYVPDIRFIYNERIKKWEMKQNDFNNNFQNY